MKKWILIVRDYGYLNWRKANHKHEEALQKGNELAIFLLTMIWSMPGLSFIAIMTNRLGYGPYAHYLKFLTDQNPLLKIVFGAILFAPFYWLARWQINALKDTPIAPTMPYRRLLIISWGMLLLAFSMIAIIPLVIQELFPQ